MEEIYKPSRRMYNLFVKDFNKEENEIEWVNIAWGTIEDCLAYANKFNYKDDDYQILPTKYKCF